MSLLGSIQSSLGRSRAAAYLAVKLRNQCQCVIGNYLGEKDQFDNTGERWLLSMVAPHVHTFIDIGANVGEWTAALLQYAPADCRGILYDPSNSAQRRLVERFEVSKQLEIVNAAVSDECTEMPFFEEEGAGARSSFIAPFTNSGVRRMVPVVTLDCEAKEKGITHIDLLKIDAEGFDYRVLKGARGLLSRRDVSIIQFEYNEPWAQAGSTLAGAVSLLNANGYEVFLLKRQGLFRFDYALWGEFFAFSNWVAIVPERMPHIARGVREQI